MKVIQMQYSPDAFDSFMKEKLEEVEPDPALAEYYWNKIDPEINRGGSPGRRRFIYFSLSLLTVAIATYLTVPFLDDPPQKKPHLETAIPRYEQPGTIKSGSRPPVVVIPAGENKPSPITRQPHISSTGITATHSTAETASKALPSPDTAGRYKLTSGDVLQVGKPDIIKTTQPDSLTNTKGITTLVSKDSNQARHQKLPGKEEKKTRVNIIW